MRLPLCNCTVVPRSVLPRPLVLLLPLADVPLLPPASVLPLTTGSVPVSALRATFRVDSSVSATHSCQKGTSDGRGRGGEVGDRGKELHSGEGRRATVGAVPSDTLLTEALQKRDDIPAILLPYAHRTKDVIPKNPATLCSQDKGFHS